MMHGAGLGVFIIASVIVVMKFYLPDNDENISSDTPPVITKFPKEINLDTLIQERHVGVGAFGVVYKGFHQRDDGAIVPVAMKIPGDECSEHDFLNEAALMEQFDHPNVVKLEGKVSRGGLLMIVTEYMEYGSLDDFMKDLRKKGQKLSSYQLLSMLRDIANGMKYLSEIGCVHRDLAARNILVDAQFVCKVSDFGLSRILQPEDGSQNETKIYRTDNSIMPFAWTAPEAIKTKIFSSSSDVWSFGVVMWEVLTYGEKPYRANECIEHGYRLPPPAFCPRVLHDLMLSCWNADTTKRPTFAQIVDRLDFLLQNPEKLEETINNRPFDEHLQSTPSFDNLVELEQRLANLNLAECMEVMMKFGCVTAEQIMGLTSRQLDEMGITNRTIQQRLLIAANPDRFQCTRNRWDIEDEF